MSRFIKIKSEHMRSDVDKGVMLNISNINLVSEDTYICYLEGGTQLTLNKSGYIFLEKELLDSNPKINMKITHFDST